MPDWSYTPLAPLASAVIGERRTQLLALGFLAGLVRTGGRRWIPVVFDHPQVPAELRHRLGAQVPVSVARDAVTVLPVQGATIVQIAPVTSNDVATVRRAASDRRCRVVALCDSDDTAAAVAPFVDSARVQPDPDDILLTDPDVRAAVGALSNPRTTVLATTELLLASGPGWFNRVIEATASDSATPAVGIDGDADTAEHPRPSTWHTFSRIGAWPAWVWAMIVGVGLIVGGLGAAVIALGPVLLGYDEDYLGLTTDGLRQIDHHLVGFLQHDRITMAGNMVGIGFLYCGLAWGGIRRGHRWARNALAISGVFAFGTWFYFLASGFIEPLHTLVVITFFPLLVIAVWRAPTTPTHPRVDDGSERERRAALWAQLVIIAVGGGLAVSGVVISTVGLTDVFVATDLGYLGTDAETLRSADEHLLPFIAHDRAGFGGALIGAGLAVLLIALWGWRRGEKWVWWTLAVGFVCGSVPALAIHLEIEYTTVIHLLPLYALIVAVIVALLLARPFLTAPSTTAGVPYTTEV